ncbi:hypothetical protein EXX00_25175, partial [Escherichia coli]
TVCVVGKIRDLILQLSKSSIYSTKPCCTTKTHNQCGKCRSFIEIHIYLLDCEIYLPCIFL